MLRSQKLLNSLIAKLENNLGVLQGAPTSENQTTSEEQKSELPDFSEAPHDLFEQIDIRVGRIIECWRHPDSEKIYCEKIDIGEENPRQIGSGLQKDVPIESMSGLVLVMANLKPRKLAGFPSEGMVLAVKVGESFDLVRPAEGSEVGERIGVEGGRLPQKSALERVLNPKKKVLEKCVPYLVTNSAGEACFGDKRLITSQGVIQTPASNSSIS